ncbi:MAG: TonB-dependent receptor, partial [bacterium]|nr:TonB-dependent receptor [bacterium]
ALRVAWGRFYQSQRLYELQVADGETAFHDAARAEHRLIGWEHTFGHGLVLSIDAYQREVDNPRPRWESLFDTWAPFPEIKPDRALIAPVSSNAEGVEVFLRRRGGKRFNWWAHYTWSSVEDEIDGLWVPRNIDQEHALVLDVNYRRAHWSFNAAWRYHTGWPTTAIWGEWVRRPNGSWDIEPVLGPYYAENLSDYHRLDVRVSRSWQLDRGTLSLFIDVQNLYDRKNERGTEFEDAEFYVLPNGDIVLSADDEEWLGMIPSFGIGWEF